MLPVLALAGCAALFYIATRETESLCESCGNVFTGPTSSANFDEEVLPQFAKPFFLGNVVCSDCSSRARGSFDKAFENFEADAIEVYPANFKGSLDPIVGLHFSATPKFRNWEKLETYLKKSAYIGGYDCVQFSRVRHTASDGAYIFSQWSGRGELLKLSDISK